MITPNAKLSISRQCMLLGVARSSFYYQPQPASAAELDLLNRLDQIFTEHPVYGSRRLQVALLREGISVGCLRIRRLMRRLGLAAVRPKRNTSKPHPEHKIYPYRLRDGTVQRVGDVDGSDMIRRTAAGWESLADLQQVDAARPAVRPRFDQPQHRPPPCPPASSGPAGHIAPVHISPISGKSPPRSAAQRSPPARAGIAHLGLY
jgi:putative transposase